MTRWRFIRSAPAPGAVNMAVDEGLLAGFDPAGSSPVFRIYGWNPAALSLGRFQESTVLDDDRCRRFGVPVVRRITGGGVIYHREEITYSLVCSTRHLPEAAGVQESFRLLTRFLLGFYRRLGLDAAWAAERRPEAGTQGRVPFCFAGSERYDIVIGTAKIGGNAQRRMRTVIFQHGSIPLADHAAEGASFLREPPPPVNTVSLRGAGVAEPAQRLAPLLAEAFAASLGVTLAESALTEEEGRAAGRLAAEKYGSMTWNMTGRE